MFYIKYRDIKRYYFFYKTTPKNRVRMNRFNMDDTVVHEDKTTKK